MAKSKRREPENSICSFSAEEPIPLYRWTLENRWDEETPSYARTTAAWIMLNPSTADSESLDATLRRCRGYSKAWGYGGMIILNLYAYRATLPRDMLAAADPVGPLNDSHIERTVAREDVKIVVAGWGSNASPERAARVMEMLVGRLTALRVNADGMASHPLYLPASLQPVPYGLQLAPLPNGPSTT